MKECFRIVKFRADKAALLEKALAVVTKYQGMGYKLTLRQLYYQLVAAGVIPNNIKEYGKLSDLVTDARMGGFLDWSAIEDRGRVPHMHAQWETLADLVSSAKAQFRLPRWADQTQYVELWTEKDALTSILLPITEEYHIRLIVNKGYSSASAMYAASKRFISASRQGKELVLLYLGDHDPSGLDMDRDIGDRMREFGVQGLEVDRIGLIMEQIERLQPPENPAKIADPRAGKYIEEYGDVSWEVDAIPPEELDILVRECVESHIDMTRYESIKERETVLTTKLEQAVAEIEEEVAEEDNE